jgi:outer membrane lipoprotein-sorting protein
MKKISLFLVVIVGFSKLSAQSSDLLMAKLKEKLAKVKDYSAVAQLKTDVAFLKLPISKVNIFYKYPDQFQIKKEVTPLFYRIFQVKIL